MPVLTHLNSENLFYIFIILLQLFIVLIFALTTRSRRTKRKQVKAARTALMEKWAGLIVDADIGIITFEDIPVPKGEEKALLPPVLIDIIKSLSATSKAVAIKVYKHFGYLEKDHSALESISFERQISALSRIETIQDKDSVPYVKNLQNHKNFYIRSASLRFLVKNDWSSVDDFETKLNELSKRKQFDTMFEVVCNLAVFQRKVFERAVKHADQPDIKKVFLKTIALYRINESLPFVRKSLGDLIKNEKFDTGLLKMHLLCLTIAPDEETEILLRHLAKHPRQDVRYLAQCSLFVIRPDLKSEILNSVADEDKAGLQQAFENFATSLGKVIYG